MNLIKMLFVIMVIVVSGCSDSENPYSPTPNPKSWGPDDLYLDKEKPKEQPEEKPAEE